MTTPIDLTAIRAFAEKCASLKVEEDEAPIYDRAAKEPGGVECIECGRIFIGEPWHSLCAVCFAKPSYAQLAESLDQSLSHLRELVAEVERLQLVVQWQPMETALKDGTLVLLLIKADDDYFNAVEDGLVARTIGSYGVHGGPEEDPTAMCLRTARACRTWIQQRGVKR